MSTARLGLDIGGTKIALGLVDEQGRVLARRRIDTAGAGDGAPLLERLAADRKGSFRSSPPLAHDHSDFAFALSSHPTRVVD